MSDEKVRFKSLEIAQAVMDMINGIEATESEKWTALQIASLLPIGDGEDARDPLEPPA